MLTEYNSLPLSIMNRAGTTLFLEAAPGTARRHTLQQWLQDREQQQETINWFLACNFDEGGAWAGLQELLQDIVPHLEQHAPALLSKHSYELCLAAPALQQRIQASHLTLTDIAEKEEHVRNYPADRAYRSLHGLIDLLDSWYALGEKKPMVIICDQFDQACPLVQLFFMELMRRRGQKLQLTLLLAVAPGQSTTIIDRYPHTHISGVVQLDLPSNPPPIVPRERIIQDAQELEQRVKQDRMAADTSTPRLISLLEQSGQTEQALYWKIHAAQRFNHLGIYDASFRYCPEIDAKLDLIYRIHPQLYPLAINTLYFCYIPLGHIEKAYRVMTEKVVDRIHSQPFLSQWHYLTAMLYARFLPQRDLAKAVTCLEQGLSLLSAADALPKDEQYFHKVFLGNGLAYVRTQQKRPEEAVALCSEGLALLNQHLASNKHRLHRSVLVYNIAQVYAATHQFDKALATFEAVINMDPNYSEYYNDRGSIHLKVGHLHEAEQDYVQAIELSPPYPEVWINLGQCYRAMERVHDAITAYTRALDLNPTEVLPLVARAEMYTELGCWEEAMADYNAVLKLEPQSPLVLAARAVIHYEIGHLELAVSDLNAAIALAPNNPVFYQNRATALIDLGHVQDAASDLQQYLQLEPDAEDHSEVEELLLSLA